MRSIFNDADYDRDIPLNVKEYTNKYLDPINQFLLKDKKASIFLHGSVGKGKTHIAHAVKKKFDSHFGPWFTEIYNFTNLAIRVKIKPESEDEISLDKVAGHKGLLIIDDFGSKQPSNSTIDNMYVILDYRYEHMLPTMVTSNLTLEEIETIFGNRISTRIARMSVDVELK